VGFVAAAHGDARGEFDSVASLYLPVALAVFVLVVGAMLVVVVRYRARPGRVPAPTGEHREREVAFAALIAAVAAVLVVRTFSTEDVGHASAARPDLRVDVTSFRWGWRFAYPGLGAGVASTSGPDRPAILRVPAGALVRFGIVSRDVIHAFWIPELRFKHDLFPGRRDSFELRFPKATAFLGGRCAVFCGLKHPDMTFSVMVMPAADFAAWVRAQRGRAA
jgi:cytochrome c oxidase subunit 2